MKKLFTITALLLLSGKLFAQIPGNTATQTNLPPLPTREVSGIVKDAKGQTIPGATITLTSTSDTLSTSTNEDGIFIFKGIKQATFFVTIKAIGLVTSTRKYLNNDAIKRIILDPVEMKDEVNMLNQVTINGTPSITYKTDTVEYKASDYKVRANATLDEMLKKAEGFEVGTDGTLTHQGQQITKARLNGKDYAGGDVAQAIQNLPADIVEKFQVVDDYGDQAGRTGVKDGDPTKVLNVTTRSDKSVGNIARVTASAGSNDRYDERLFAQRLNANQQIVLIGSLRNTVNGVASSGLSSGLASAGGGGNTGGGGGGNRGGGGGGGGGGNTGGGSTGGSSGSGGTTTAGSPTFSYRDQWSKYVQVNGSYGYSFNNVNSISDETGERTSTFGNTLFARTSNGENNNKTHNASFEFEYTPDSLNFLRITPGFSYTGTNTMSSTHEIQTGFQNQDSKGVSSSRNTTPSYSAVLLYQHLFKSNKRRNISFQFNLNNGNQQQNTEQNTEIKYNDANQTLIKDSLVHRTIERSNMTQNYRASLTYVEPLTRVSQLEFNAQTNYRGYRNTGITSNVNTGGTSMVIDSLSNVYKYSFTETRVALNYRLIKPKYNLSLGITAIPTHLAGDNISKNTSTERSNFYTIPVFRFQYQWSRQQQLAISYTGTPTEPSFTQIQPLPDFSNPQSPVYGNPDLKPSFRHSLTLRYNNYISNSKLNLSANVNASLYKDQIANNYVEVRQPGLQSYIYETHYVNLSGAKSVQGNYNVAKYFDSRKYYISLNGSVNYGYSLGMSNNTLNHVTSWNFTERIGPRINPSDAIEVNPFVSYELNRSFNSITTATTSNYTRTALNLEGKFYFGKDKTWTFEYDLSKNYINGISTNVSKNPFVTNAYIEKQFFERKNGILRISAFDVFNQNNFVNRIVTQNGYTDTKSNALSRYVMVSFILNLQKWTGVSQRNGRTMQRRGDGSFIY